MPELPEVERYRLLAEQRALGRSIASVDARDGWYLKKGTVPALLRDLLIGEQFVAARRRGKLMMLDVSGDSGTVLGLRFGMSGRLLVDGSPGVDQLLYLRAEAAARFERFAIVFDDGGRLVMNDPRRLGGVQLDPDEARLGPDASTLTLAELRRALDGAQVALKARLLDQSKVAGVGNLIADEILWRAGFSPLHVAADLTPAELRRLHKHLSSGLAELVQRGGSHTGDLMAQRRFGGMCPKDGTPLVRATVGGRTSWWCPRHQK